MDEMELIIFGVIRVSISCHQVRLHLCYCDSIAKRETSGKRKKSQRWYLLFVAFPSIIMSLSMNSLLREAHWILLVSFTRSSIYWLWRRRPNAAWITRFPLEILTQKGKQGWVGYWKKSVGLDGCIGLE